MTWRLILDGDLPGARNMARDVAILHAVADGLAPPTLRLYGWNPPCLTLGRHQGPEAANLDFCQAEGIDVVRRPTGGRALLHDIELTYAVVAPVGTGPLPRNLQEAYRSICNGLVHAVKALGVDADLTGGEVNLQLPGPTTTVPCFEAPAGGEVMVAGRKLIGSAMRAHGSAILQHGAILIGWNGRLQAGAMGLPDDSSLRRRVTTLEDETGRHVVRSILEQALVDALADELGVEFVTSEMSTHEHALESELRGSFSLGV